jgi:hypothetical protein
MVTLLLTSILIIGFLGLALYFWQKPAKNSERASLAPLPPPRSLFGEPNSAQPSAPETSADDSKKQRLLLAERAGAGDKSALAEAHALGDKEFYNQILDSLVAATDSDAAALSLVSYVARHELPVNGTLARAVLDSWSKAPDRNSTAKALHVAALADDAELYQGAVEAALQYFRTGKLADVSPLELQALFDGEFWVLSQHTRGSGAGFVLKRTLANARRELGSTTSSKQ